VRYLPHIPSWYAQGLPLPPPWSALALQILIAGKMKITVIEYKPAKCTFSKLIF
jgi:hypothetical protein